jgi:hypothetical protein
MTKEKALWWSELGECIRSKEIDVTKPRGKQLREFYYKQMETVLQFPPEPSLVTQAKKSGTTEI